MGKLFLIIISVLSVIAVMGCASQTASPAASVQKIDITYTSLLLPSAQWIGTLPTLPGSGTSTLIVNLNIVDYGYDSFTVNQTYFSVVAKDSTYNNSDCPINNALKTSTISDGGTLKGSIPFSVPATTTDFTMKYTGQGKYNINWIAQ